MLNRLGARLRAQEMLISFESKFDNGFFFIGRPKKSGFVDGLCITFIPDLAELVPEHGPK
ncbi:MAG: hypothetical protein ACTHZ7_13920 [Sphingobacterium sp.]